MIAINDDVKYLYNYKYGLFGKWNMTKILLQTSFCHWKCFVWKDDEGYREPSDCDQVSLPQMPCFSVHAKQFVLTVTFLSS